MDDLISRRDAIDAVHRNYDTILDFKSDGRTVAESFEDIVNALPTAQPDLCDGCDRYGASCVGEGCEKLEMSEVAKDTNVPINDCISRQAAIDALDNIKIPRNASWYPYYQQALTAMSRLPSAQPEEASMILGTSKDGVRLWYICSVCGEPANADDNYCCNCGRKFINV